jgi:hypothetical protein
VQTANEREHIQSASARRTYLIRRTIASLENNKYERNPTEKENEQEAHEKSDQRPFEQRTDARSEKTQCSKGEEKQLPRCVRQIGFLV